MPVNREWIEPYAAERPDLYQALTSLADQSDAIEAAAGLLIPATGQAQAATPGPPQAFSVTAASGHFAVAITPPANTPPPLIQYQLQSGLDQNWNSASGVATYTLGFGAQTLDVVDPGVTKYWRARWRSVGSAWSGWQTYSGSQGVVALSSGNLATT